MSEEVRRKLMGMKLELGYSSVEELLKAMIANFEEKQLEKTSESFRKKLKERNLTLEGIMRENEKIRKEIYKEWFQK
ncbi:MAG TPA: hypothetical protein VED00_03015 [archaeon]|nr:hypothetical protein [archaeon]